MTNENKDSRSCTNCKYFIKHYVKNKTYFYAIDCGHCGNFKLPRNKRSNCPFVNDCVRWEQTEEIDSADEIGQIKTAIVNMQKHLEDITSILTIMKSD